jgi:hypothetical protein
MLWKSIPTYSIKEDILCEAEEKNGMTTASLGDQAVVATITRCARKW